MKKTIFLLALLFFATAGNAQSADADKKAINQTLNDWHKAAAEAKFDAYFGFMAADAIYIGTDAAENWNLQQFKDFSRPYFDKGKAWNFTPLQRNIYFNKDHSLAWFDELLDTQMKICRGSGILRKENGQWKIAHYVLSMTVPNDRMEEVVKIKSTLEDACVKKLKDKP